MLLVRIGTVLRQGSDTITEWVDNVAYMHIHTHSFTGTDTHRNMFYYLLERKKIICKDEYALLMLLTTCLDAGEKVDENLQWGGHGVER